MAVTLPTVDDVAAYRVGPAENWTGNAAAITPALYAATYWISALVPASDMPEADAITNPDGPVDPNKGDLWRLAVILKTWAFLYTGLLPVTEVQGHEISVRYQQAVNTNTIAKQYDEQAQVTIQMVSGVNLVISGFSDINTNTQSALDASADLTALSVRGW